MKLNHLFTALSLLPLTLTFTNCSDKPEEGPKEQTVVIIDSHENHKTVGLQQSIQFEQGGITHSVTLGRGYQGNDTLWLSDKQWFTSVKEGEKGATVLIDPDYISSKKNEDYAFETTPPPP